MRRHRQGHAQFTSGVSNVLWTIWGWHARAFALIALQLGLFVLNVRGARKNEPLRLRSLHPPDPIAHVARDQAPGDDRGYTRPLSRI
jgi:hypothetical protein